LIYPQVWWPAAARSSRRPPRLPKEPLPLAVEVLLQRLGWLLLGVAAVSLVAAIAQWVWLGALTGLGLMLGAIALGVDGRAQVTSYPRRLRQYDREMEVYLRQLTAYSQETTTRDVTFVATGLMPVVPLVAALQTRWPDLVPNAAVTVPGLENYGVAAVWRDRALPYPLVLWIDPEPVATLPPEGQLLLQGGWGIVRFLSDTAPDTAVAFLQSLTVAKKG